MIGKGYVFYLRFSKQLYKNCKKIEPWIEKLLKYFPDSCSLGSARSLGYAHILEAGRSLLASRILVVDHRLNCDHSPESNEMLLSPTLEVKN